MTLYNVHIYREMKLTFGGIEAESPEAAANIARDRLTEDADAIDDCDGDTFSALVDVAGDEDFSQSRLIDFDQPKPTRTSSPSAGKPAIAVVSIRDGLVEEVRANHPLHVLIEDWDGTEVRPSHDPIVPEPMLPGEEAALTHFFEPTTDQGEKP
jgi:hypothetical protein